MAIDTENIKKALDDFENDDFLSAKDRIKGEIHGAVHDYFKTKLGLERDIELQKDNKSTDTTNSDGNAGDASDTE